MSAVADTLVLRDGNRREGTVVSLSGRTITFRHSGGATRRYSTSDIDAIEFGSADRRGDRDRNGRQDSQDSQDRQNRSGQSSSNNRRIDAPAGTELAVRTVETIDSDHVAPGQSYAALVEEGVRDDAGRVIIPAGSSARLVVRRVSEGTVKSGPEMVLDIQSISISGHQFVTSTNDLSLGNDTGIGKNQRTAQTVGGGALLGTIIGAIAGGGKGAAIGGVVGAAGGAGAQIVTRGRDVHVPAETVLRFRLDRAATFRSDW